MTDSALTALSPLDGRYRKQTEALGRIFSEAGLIRYRLRVELAWLVALSEEPTIREVPPLDDAQRRLLDALVDNLDLRAAARIKAIEARINHDVKAVEYYLRERIDAQAELKHLSQFVHFGCTSEDINNLAYALMVRAARRDLLQVELVGIERRLAAMAHALAEQPMLARTHGQPASPTTLGKELANVAARLNRQIEQISDVRIMGKCNGAVGNYNAQVVAYPDTDWPAVGRRFVTGLGLEFQPYTTQIEPHDYLAELAHALTRANTVLLDLARDLWGYIALGYFRQRVVAGEVGSSTMPHKVNPIDFENAEGNFGLANALLTHMAEKLPISRWQRDLSDSTVLRSLGSALGYCLVGYGALARGLDKLDTAPERLAADLDQAWEVLAEAIQTLMRRHGLPDPYERLKAFSRGQKLDQAAMTQFVQELELPADAKQRLLELTPATYTGLAARLAKGLE